MTASPRARRRFAQLPNGYRHLGDVGGAPFCSFRAPLLEPKAVLGRERARLRRAVKAVPGAESTSDVP